MELHNIACSNKAITVTWIIRKTAQYSWGGRSRNEKDGHGNGVNQIVIRPSHISRKLLTRLLVTTAKNVDP